MKLDDDLDSLDDDLGSNVAPIIFIIFVIVMIFLIIRISTLSLTEITKTRKQVVVIGEVYIKDHLYQYNIYDLQHKYLGKTDRISKFFSKDSRVLMLITDRYSTRNFFYVKYEKPEFSWSSIRYELIQEKGQIKNEK